MAFSAERMRLSVLDDDSLYRLLTQRWELTGLIRVWLRGEARRSQRARRSSTRRARFTTNSPNRAPARATGPSAKFDTQRVGGEHTLADGDIVEILSPPRGRSGK